MEFTYGNAQRYHKNHNNPSFLVEKGKRTVFFLRFPGNAGGMLVKQLQEHENKK